MASFCLHDKSLRDLTNTGRFVALCRSNNDAKPPFAVVEEQFSKLMHQLHDEESDDSRELLAVQTYLQPWNNICYDVCIISEGMCTIEEHSFSARYGIDQHQQTQTRTLSDSLQLLLRRNIHEIRRYLIETHRLKLESLRCEFVQDHNQTVWLLSIAEAHFRSPQPIVPSLALGCMTTAFPARQQRPQSARPGVLTRRPLSRRSVSTVASSAAGNVPQQQTAVPTTARIRPASARRAAGTTTTIVTATPRLHSDFIPSPRSSPTVALSTRPQPRQYVPTAVQYAEPDTAAQCRERWNEWERMHRFDRQLQIGSHIAALAASVERL